MKYDMMYHKREDKAMSTATTLLDELRRRGFTPHDSGENWFDLPIGLHLDRNGPGPRFKIRVAVDDRTVFVYVSTGNGVALWDVTLSDNTPPNVVTTVIDLAIAHAVTIGADECE